MKDLQDESWELIYSSPALYKAEIVKSILEEENILCVLVNKQDSSYLNFGEIEIYTKREDILVAKQILNRIDEIE